MTDANEARRRLSDQRAEQAARDKRATQAELQTEQQLATGEINELAALGRRAATLLSEANWPQRVDIEGSNGGFGEGVDHPALLNPNGENLPGWCFSDERYYDSEDMTNHRTRAVFVLADGSVVGGHYVDDILTHTQPYVDYLESRGENLGTKLRLEFDKRDRGANLRASHHHAAAFSPRYTDTERLANFISALHRQVYGSVKTPDVAPTGSRPLWRRVLGL